MAKKTYCDLCENEVNNSVSIEFRDGEHPHNNSTMYKGADVCFDCLRKVRNLSSSMEFDYIRELCK